MQRPGARTCEIGSVTGGNGRFIGSVTVCEPVRQWCELGIEARLMWTLGPDLLNYL